ncbi:multidrug efflux SMR transporter [Paenibacillus sp. S150]|uniref:DMT family transporter n=1 Tax=Paenibacillus sp. S150 TaxID=2749826 RepID=UPI001C5708C1|nr:multidrug efflux SMR transporter [Paenibacillus sp. S150]MBW4082482.1 multidrug efflux SMR transporter [Paenibacillus sp. S150]
MAWLLLVLAGLSEVASVPLLKRSQGLSRLMPAVSALAALALSFYCLSRSLISIPVGTAYAVWTGIGSCGAILTGILFYGESAGAGKLAALLCMIIGMIGLSLTS